MALRFQRFRHISRLIPRNSSGNLYGLSRRSDNFHSLQSNSFRVLSPNIGTYFEDGDIHCRRLSTLSQNTHESLNQVDLLSIIESTSDMVEGPSHFWLNKVEDSKKLFGRNAVFLVLAGAFVEEYGNESVKMFEKVKSLQQRHPELHVMGFQSCKAIFSDAVNAQLLKISMREFITFPVLLSTNDISEIIDGPCYILFQGSRGPKILFEKNIDLGEIDNAIKTLNVLQRNEKPESVNKLESTWVKPIQVIMEPYCCSSLQNLLLYYPGCISVDESTERLFLSDVNHHRIIVSNGSGAILDTIGSSPGFEDGEFQFAKLTRPAASFYHTAEDCLYFVDSENHAIRRADIERRVVETLYPTCNINKTSNSLWSWIVDKLWTKKDADQKSENYDSKSFLFPWHMMQSMDGDLYVLNRSFETLWIMDVASGAIKDVIKGVPKILEICGHMILEKSDLVKEMPLHWLQQQVSTNCSLEGMPYAGLMSSVATFQDHLIICDTVGQRLLKLNNTSGSVTNFPFSNFGTLGLPYWLSYTLERVYAGGDVLSGCRLDHSQHFSLLPGRIDIQLIVDIPEDTVLVEPLKEGSIWRQARGTATVVSEAKNKAASSEKVGVAQQWYNELDDLAALSEVKLSTEGEERTFDGELQEGKICIESAINTSPGTCEVMINAAIYLKLKSCPNSTGDSREESASRIAHHLSSTRGHSRRDQCIQHLLASNGDLADLIFMRPLNVKLLFECLNHPKATNSKDIILTNSSIEVNVTLS